MLFTLFQKMIRTETTIAGTGLISGMARVSQNFDQCRMRQLLQKYDLEVGKIWRRRVRGTLFEGSWRRQTSKEVCNLLGRDCDHLLCFKVGSSSWSFWWFDQNKGGVRKGVSSFPRRKQKRNWSVTTRLLWQGSVTSARYRCDR